MSKDDIIGIFLGENYMWMHPKFDESLNNMWIESEIKSFKIATDISQCNQIKKYWKHIKRRKYLLWKLKQIIVSEEDRIKITRLIKSSDFRNLKLANEFIKQRL
jgi:hypothetical protein